MSEVVGVTVTIDGAGTELYLTMKQAKELYFSLRTLFKDWPEGFSYKAEVPPPPPPPAGPVIGVNPTWSDGTTCGSTT